VDGLCFPGEIQGLILEPKLTIVIFKVDHCKVLILTFLSFMLSFFAQQAMQGNLKCFFIIHH